MTALAVGTALEAIGTSIETSKSTLLTLGKDMLVAFYYIMIPSQKPS